LGSREDIENANSVVGEVIGGGLSDEHVSIVKEKARRRQVLWLYQFASRTHGIPYGVGI
jgi:hypothetical protein